MFNFSQFLGSLVIVALIGLALNKFFSKKTKPFSAAISSAFITSLICGTIGSFGMMDGRDWTIDFFIIAYLNYLPACLVIGMLLYFKNRGN